MSEPENFITRWSRRKREAAQEAEATKPSAAPDVAADHARAQDDERDANDAAAARSSSGERPPPAFDPAKLPPIETITAESDIRAFLAPGVPPELTRAALRRAWVADPKIRDFVGLADYDWDFNAPGAIAGFGSLEMTDELRREVARMVGRSLGGEDSERPAPIAAEGQADRPSVETSAESVATTGKVPTQASQSNRGRSQNDPAAADSGRHNSTVELQCNEVDIAAQYDRENHDSDQVIAKRPHGSALPKE
jgi:Protein of unknown function (DUF3306)